MATVTTKGRALAWRLNRYIGTTYEIEQTCSLIARAATTYARIQEIWCSVELSDYWTGVYEERETQLERRISNLVASLPVPDYPENDRPWRVRFDGDPRGYVVSIIHPEQVGREAGREIGVA